MSSAISTPAWPTARIAVVDDDPDVAAYLRILITGSGYHDVVSYTDGQAALDAQAETPADLILLDLRMPDMDGREVLERLRRHEANQHVPVVVLTANEATSARREALDAGATDFLLKPPDPVELRQRVANLLELRRLHLELQADNVRLNDVVSAQGQELAAYKDILDEVLDPVVVIDATTLRIAYANLAAQRYTGLDEDRLVGRAPKSVHPLLAASVTRPRVAELLSGLCDSYTHEGRADLNGHRVDVVVQRVDINPGRPLLVAVAHDVEHRARTEDGLREALRASGETLGRLRRVEDLRRDFVTAVSHEVRTPLTVVSGLSGVLAERLDELEHDRLRMICDRLDHHAQRLSRLLLDMLDVSLEEPLDITPQLEPTRLDQLVRETLGRHGLGGRHVEVALDKVAAEVAPARVARSVDALLDNVLRHTPPNAAVRLTATVVGDRAHLCVEDSGPGVPADERQRIFAPFVQGARRNDHNPGTGIGLAAVDLCARLHGGTAWVDDSSLGGAAFHVELPLRQSAATNVAAPAPDLSVVRSPAAETRIGA